MRILVTNDDGIAAPGLLALSETAARFGHVKIVAPDSERSACGRAMTMRDPLRVVEVEVGALEGYAVSGSPVDCVNVALSVAWPEGCDLVLSGVNDGPNLGVDVTYSGTVAGAMEGAVNGIRSIAISLAGFGPGPKRFETACAWLADRWDALLAFSPGPAAFLNVNVPDAPFSELRGDRVAPLGGRIYVDRVEARADPWGRPYYWQGGASTSDEPQPGTDLEAIRAGEVSITPIALDWTHRESLPELARALGLSRTSR